MGKCIFDEKICCNTNSGTACGQCSPNPDAKFSWQENYPYGVGNPYEKSSFFEEMKKVYRRIGRNRDNGNKNN